MYTVCKIDFLINRTSSCRRILGISLCPENDDVAPSTFDFIREILSKVVVSFTVWFNLWWKVKLGFSQLMKQLFQFTLILFNAHGKL
jgi:hypothetical protein